MIKSNLKILLFSIILNSCITPFIPDGITSTGKTLVVEGDIILNDTTKIFLSESIPLDQDNTVKYITNANVWVENEKGDRYFGIFIQNPDLPPFYAINTNGLDYTLKYKLCIALSDGKSYESDSLSISIAPQIDSIGFIVNSKKTFVDFYVNTKGENENSRYYKWKYREDWEFTSIYKTAYYYDPLLNIIFDLPDEQNMFYCWNKSFSSSILIAKTDHLENNIIYQKKLTTMDASDRRINYLYSMELYQMTISKEAYQYWSNLEKNSNELGGIFAPQPSEQTGNIKCISNPDEKVLGFISAGTISIKRIFAKSFDINVYKDPFCASIEDSSTYLALYDRGYYIIDKDPEFSTPTFWAKKECVDCKIYGTKNKPSFWPNNHK